MSTCVYAFSRPSATERQVGCSIRRHNLIATAGALLSSIDGGRSGSKRPQVVNITQGEEVVKHLISQFVREEEGQDIIEYALLAAFVSIVAATIISTIGDDVKTIYGNVKTQTGLAATASGS